MVGVHLIAVSKLVWPFYDWDYRQKVDSKTLIKPNDFNFKLTPEVHVLLIFTYEALEDSKEEAKKVESVDFKGLLSETFTH